MTRRGTALAAAVGLVVAAFAPLNGQTAGAALPQGETVDLTPTFADVEEATVVVLDAARGVTRYRPDLARTRVRPASTFKIPNTVIALETGVAHGPDFRLPWDSTQVPRTRFFPDSWARDQTLRSAFRNSVYWFYQEVARRVGSDRMQAWLRRFDYGNRSVAGGVDRFWLEGGLRISPDEQVRFLQRLVTGHFEVSSGAVDALRDMALLGEHDGWRLYGKTGTSRVTATRENGWIVGWVESAADTAYFAINMEGERVWEAWPPQRRHDLALEVLREVGVLP